MNPDTAACQLDQMQETLDKLRGIIARISVNYDPGNPYVQGYKDALSDIAQDMGLE